MGSVTLDLLLKAPGVLSVRACAHGQFRPRGAGMAAAEDVRLQPALHFCHQARLQSLSHDPFLSQNPLHGSHSL